MYILKRFFLIDSGYIDKSDKRRVARYNRFQNYAYAVSFLFYCMNNNFKHVDL